MKNVIIGILALTTVALGVIAFQKHGELALNSQKIAALQTELEKLEAASASQDQETARLRQRLDAAQQESAANAAAAARVNLKLTNQIDEIAAEIRSNTKPANPLKDMFKSQEMRDMIKQQQKTVFAGMIDKNYSDFIKGLQLTPEQEAQFKDLLTKKMSVGAEIGMEMLAGDLTPEQREEIMKQAKESTAAVSDEIKQFLGEDWYAAYESYEKSVPDRMAISTFKDQLSGGDMALSADQEQMLIQALGEERSGFKFTTDFNQQNDYSQDIFSKLSEENLNRFFQEQDQLNQLYLNRAKSILTADQYAAYEKSLKTQQEMVKMSMKMAASMFGTKGN